jgi:uncharacterized protein YndB with AHSA1/START domain
VTERPTGRTKDAGWEIGVSRTLDHSVERVWDFLTSDAGTAVWLGAGVQRLDEPGSAYETEAGTAGEIRSFRPHDRVRLTWRPEDWDHDSTVQFTVSSVPGDRTRVVFHQERLADAAERERQRTHWQGVMDALETALERRPAPERSD